MDLDVPALVRAYWSYRTLAQGDRQDRLASQDLYWAYNLVGEAVDSGDDRVLVILDALLEAPEADPAYVGAGPVEDLLTADRPGVEAALAERCRRSERWREAVASVWLDDDVHDRLPRLAPYLPPRQRPLRGGR